MYDGKVNVADVRVVDDGVPNVLARKIGLLFASSPGSFDTPCFTGGLTNNLIDGEGKRKKQKKKKLLNQLVESRRQKRLFLYVCMFMQFNLILC